MVNDDVGFRERHFPLTTSMEMYFRDFGPVGGAAIPVICLHGYWRTCRDFEELALHLARTRRVVTPDLRGRGRTSRSTNAADYHFDLLRQDVTRLLDSLGIRRAVFIGTALGAQLAMEIANLSPACVAGIVMNDSGPEANAAAGNHMAKFASADELTYEEALAKVRTQYAADFPRFGESDWQRYVHRGYRETDAGKYVRDFDQLTNVDAARLKSERGDFWREYRNLTGLPVAILRGANSRFLSEDIVARMLITNPAARLYTIPNVGHPPSLYEEESLAAVDDFMEQY